MHSRLTSALATRLNLTFTFAKAALRLLLHACTTAPFSALGLARTLTRQGSFTEMDASRITRQMTEAIQYLHEQGIVHRDLKVYFPPLSLLTRQPENLLFRDRTPQSDILVTDFGLAKLVLLNSFSIFIQACFLVVHRDRQNTCPSAYMHAFSQAHM